jgi:ubiquinone/menaquinone biosynthesis C-methylase UbiE
MGVYGELVLPIVTDRVCGFPGLSERRARACADLSGHVLEIGFGSGHNVPHYPATVTRVTAVEPSDLAWRLARGRREESAVPVVRAGLDGQDLPFADGTFDAALSTFTLCTIPDGVRALREVRRVLTPGGRLHFLEHGRAPDPGVRTWQRRLGPVQRRLGGGCRLDVAIDELVEEAGFALERLSTGYVPKEPKPYAYLYEGRAVG